MSFTSRALRVSLLVIGLGVTACGTQSDAGIEPAVANPPKAAVGSVPESVTITPPSNEPIDAIAGQQLSPLASRVVPLPSALPDRVLPGLGDVVGVRPESISIPGLGVSGARIVPVGLEANGELEVPGADEVGWYRFGVGVDGGRGSTVLAAHIAYNGRDGVFRNLADAEVGQQIAVDVGEVEVTYEIVAIDQYGKFDLPIDELFAEDGAERLVLITCGGSFNPDLRSYDDNVVVVATPLL
jgi:LPXTG-site transpeptidase (sortase) family protein